jgi:hypothetical protein
MPLAGRRLPLQPTVVIDLILLMAGAVGLSAICISTRLQASSHAASTLIRREPESLMMI